MLDTKDSETLLFKRKGPSVNNNNNGLEISQIQSERIEQDLWRNPFDFFYDGWTEIQGNAGPELNKNNSQDGNGGDSKIVRIVKVRELKVVITRVNRRLCNDLVKALT